VHGIADELSVDVQTVRRWIQSGKLRAFKPGKEYRVREADLEEFLAAREVRPKARGRSSQELSLLDGLEADERPLRYLRAWRAFVLDLLSRWQEKPPQTSGEILPLVSAMEALVEQGVFDPSSAASASVEFELQLIIRGLKELNDIADKVAENVEEHKRRRNNFELIPGALNA
jgi:excisionase family DNA binding protein